MTLFKKRSPPPARRQRLQPSDNPIPRVFSYHARRSEEVVNTGRQLQRADNTKASKRVGSFWLQRFGTLVLLIVGCVCMVNILSLNSRPKVVILGSVSSALPNRSQAVYEQAASKLLAASLWNHNKITVDTAKISSQLSEQFPSLTSVSITLPLVTPQPVIYLQSAQPALILTATNGSFIIDTQGKVVAIATPSLLSSLYLPTLIDNTNSSVNVGQQVLTSNQVTFLQTIVTELAARHVSISSLSLVPGASEVDAHLSGLSYYAKFNLAATSGGRQQAGTFLAVQNHLQSQQTLPAKYIDVRVDGRAYYQ